MLYPKDTSTRQTKSLDGLWQFKADLNNEGQSKGWHEKPLEDAIAMPVPASYNDLVQDAAIRDHIGDVWYETEMWVPQMWKGSRIVLRFGSAAHQAEVWVNGQKAMEHKGGFLPFEADISGQVRFDEPNRITVRANNILSWQTLPPGEIKTYEDPKHPEGFKIQEYHFDFFNYSGIQRPVVLYSTPAVHIADLAVTTDLKDGRGIVKYEVTASGADEKSPIQVRLYDEKGVQVASGHSATGELVVEAPELWEPGRGYLYRLTAEITGADGSVTDQYTLSVGIRTVRMEKGRLLVNGKPVYLKGFGKHEDADLRGRGLDHAVNVKDFNLLKWIGANSFRTSHYPYSDELMDLADREGILVIDEVPAVGMNIWGSSTQLFCEERVNQASLDNHLSTIRELIARDKNHPCVIMWSVGNEAATFEDGAVPYFKALAEETRRLDSLRPVTLVQSSFPEDDKVAQFFDVICLNRYYSWYSDAGHLELIPLQLESELRGWHEKYGLSIIVTEYGADAIAGFHQDPPVMFSEEYQCEMINEYHKVFDRLDFVIGEHVWNFADFATKQGVTRIIGNRKGVFTRQRQPKAAAHLFRKRWTGDEIPNK
jgi:beta-glucuronidase